MTFLVSNSKRVEVSSSAVKKDINSNMVVEPQQTTTMNVFSMPQPGVNVENREENTKSRNLFYL